VGAANRDGLGCGTSWPVLTSLKSHAAEKQLRSAPDDAVAAPLDRGEALSITAGTRYEQGMAVFCAAVEQTLKAVSRFLLADAQTECCLVQLILSG